MNGEFQFCYTFNQCNSENNRKYNYKAIQHQIVTHKVKFDTFLTLYGNGWKLIFKCVLIFFELLIETWAFTLVKYKILLQYAECVGKCYVICLERSVFILVKLMSCI